MNSFKVRNIGQIMNANKSPEGESKFLICAFLLIWAFGGKNCTYLKVLHTVYQLNILAIFLLNELLFWKVEVNISVKANNYYTEALYSKLA